MTHVEQLALDNLKAKLGGLRATYLADMGHKIEECKRMGPEQALQHTGSKTLEAYLVSMIMYVNKECDKLTVAHERTFPG